MFALHNLVLYKNKPARIVALGDKIEIEILGGSNQKVRPKDVQLLHVGPLRSLAELEPAPIGDLVGAWELLSGESCSLADLADLGFGLVNPATVWGAWQWLQDGLYFTGTPEQLSPQSAAWVEQRLAERLAKQEELNRWEHFLQHLKQAQFMPEDKRYWLEIEQLAYGKTQKSKALAAIGRGESPESAHSLLLRAGLWDSRINPYPSRAGVSLQPVDLPWPTTLPEEERQDLSHLAAYAIDDEGSLDPDDAISLEVLPQGGYRLWVHVSDVAALVQPESALDLEARKRAATLYLPERIVTMLPEASVAMLGLGLAERSPALSFAITLNAEAEPQSVDICPSWVQVQRISYTEADTQIDGELAVLYQVAQRLHARRLAAGAVTLALPEVKLRLTASGDISIKPILPTRSRTVVQESMMLAGWAAAQFALEHHIPMPFAGQELNERLEHTETLPEMFAQRKQLGRTKWAAKPTMHQGLGLETYVQATSPMRRYLDLVVHQQLRAYLREQPLIPVADLLERIGAAELTSASVRDTERRSNRHWTLNYLQAYPNWQGVGVIVDRRGASVTVLIPELALECAVTGGYDIGDEVLLTVSEIDFTTLEIRFKVNIAE